MATAITLVGMGAAKSAGAARTNGGGGKHDTAAEHRLHHKDNALVHWDKIEALITKKQAKNICENINNW